MSGWGTPDRRAQDLRKGEMTMSMALAEDLWPAVCLEEVLGVDQPTNSPDDVDREDLPYVEYLWSDLKARRAALNLRQEDLAAVFGMTLQRYRTYESGGRSETAPAGLISELMAMEAFVAGQAHTMVEQAHPEGTVVLHAVVDDLEFGASYPDACTRRDRVQYPITLQHVAVGRAAAELTRRDRDVVVLRGERRFDMAAARLACGLGKNEAAYLLDLNEKTYYRAERGTRDPLEKSMVELQEIDDFIDMVAGELDISTDNAGAMTISIYDGQAAFEKAYPQAVVERSGNPYPVNVLWVAAGRCAGQLAATGQPARVVVRN